MLLLLLTLTVSLQGDLVPLVVEAGWRRAVIAAALIKVWAGLEGLTPMLELLVYDVLETTG